MTERLAGPDRQLPATSCRSREPTEVGGPGKAELLSEEVRLLASGRTSANVAEYSPSHTTWREIWSMYENDYSYLPALFAALMAIAALGGLAISCIRPNRIRARAIWSWFSVPVLFSIGLGVYAALYGENLEPSSPVLFVPIFSIIFSTLWLIAACPTFAFSRYLQGRLAE
jgi:hypothetical protein